ncbi:HNH endonuclease [Pseudomonas sp. Hg3Tf]
MQMGKLPNREWQVHHVKPLDDGGTNAFDNLTMIKNDPCHTAINNA